MKYISVLLVSLILAACGTSERAGGSGVDIPNAITLVAKHGDGSPVALGRVRIVADSKWMYYKKMGQPVVLDSMQTDLEGRFSFTPPDSESIRIEIVTGTEGISHSFKSSDSTLSLDALGSILTQWKPGATIMVMGTSYSQVADQNGRVYFPSLPCLTSGFVGEEEENPLVVLSPLSLQPHQSLVMGELQAFTSYLVVDDFEHKSAATMLDSFVHGSYWYSNADEQVGGNSTIFPSTAKSESWKSALSDSNSWNGVSLRIRYDVNASDSGSSFAILGCSLGRGINSAAIDSIAFHVRTDAPFSFSDGTRTLIHGTATESVWQRFSVHRDELDSLHLDNSLGVLQFVYSDLNGTEFQLDDFVIYGDPFELLMMQ